MRLGRAAMTMLFALAFGSCRIEPADLCNTSNCLGCCLPDGNCQVDADVLHCGSGGAECQVCALAQFCSSVAACTSGAPASGAGEVVSSTYAAAHDEPAQVLSYGGPVLTAPRFVSVSFAHDDAKLVEALDELIAAVGPTAYWKTATAEYGVGVATSAPPIHLEEDGPLKVTALQIEEWLAKKVQGDPRFGPPTPNTVYVVAYPPGSDIAYEGLQSCSGFLGYHGSMAVPGVRFAYAVLPRCRNPGLASTSTDVLLDSLTTIALHEMIEAATDPFVDEPAFRDVDVDHLAPLVGRIQEVTDLCEGAYVRDPELPFLLPKSWSNAAARGHRDPCQPATPGEVYFNAVPVMRDRVGLEYGGRSVVTRGVHIPIGTSKTIDVQLWSEAPRADWMVDVRTIGDARLSFSWDRNVGNNGTTLKLTITAQRYDPALGGAVFYLHSISGNEGNWYAGFVH